jgi:hypothetical protein
MLTSSPPQPSSVADVAPQDTRGPSAASPLPHTKPRAHALTRKSYVANQNNICPNPPPPGGYCRQFFLQYTRAVSCWRCKSSNISLPHNLNKLNSLLIVPRIQRGGCFKYFSHICCLLSYTILLLSFSPFLQTCSRNFPRPLNTSQLHVLVCYREKFNTKIIINDGDRTYKRLIRASVYELTHALSSPTMLSQK